MKNTYCYKVFKSYIIPIFVTFNIVFSLIKIYTIANNASPYSDTNSMFYNWNLFLLINLIFGMPVIMNFIRQGMDRDD